MYLFWLRGTATLRTLRFCVSLCRWTRCTHSSLNEPHFVQRITYCSNRTLDKPKVNRTPQRPQSVSGALLSKPPIISLLLPVPPPYKTTLLSGVCGSGTTLRRISCFPTMLRSEAPFGIVPDILARMVGSWLRGTATLRMCSSFSSVWRSGLGWREELLQDVLSKEFVDVPMPGNRLRETVLGVGIPVVIPTVPNQPAACFLQFANQIRSLHPSVSSATRRIPGISPPVRSRYKSRRLSSSSANVSPWVR